MDYSTEGIRKLVADANRAKAQHRVPATRQDYPVPPAEFTNHCVEVHRETLQDAVGEAYGILSFLTAVVGVFANGLGGPRR